MLGLGFRSPQGAVRRRARGGNALPEPPGGSSAELSRDESYAWCVELTRSSRSNFYFSFFTLPRALFRDMCVLYAFMRVSDDLGDDVRVPIGQRTEALAEWRRSAEAAFEGQRFTHPVLPALADVVGRHAIPTEHLFAVIDGVRMDLDFAGFETYEDLSRYCFHVAGAVGLCCIHIWGFTDGRALPLAVDCGQAFQLTNILRDVADDAAIGRCYLPREDLHRFGLRAEELVGGDGAEFQERFARLMACETGRARECFTRARCLLAYVRPEGRPILAAMIRTYGALLDAIESRGFDVRSGPVRLRRSRKIGIVIWSLIRYRWWGPKLL